MVIGDEIIYYDARRETVAAARWRGKSHSTTPALRHRVNEFFLRYGSTIALRRGVQVRVFRGPIGSGSAVVTDTGSDIVRFLRRFNEKTLAVETEAGGVGQAFYEEIGSEPASGWLTIRGISDLADRDKGHGCHQFAADHAAAVMDRLLPMLAVPGGRPDARPAGRGLRAGGPRRAGLTRGGGGRVSGGRRRGAASPPPSAAASRRGRAA